MNSLKNEKINSTLIKVEALQQEYEVTLQKYQEAGKNYIAALQYGTLNPCANYTKDSTGISQTCYNQIWKDQGCTTQPRNAKDGWTENQTLEHLAYDTFKWAILTDDTHRKGCYGNSTNYSTKTSPVYPDTSDTSTNKNNNTSYFSALKGRSWWGVHHYQKGALQHKKNVKLCAQIQINVPEQHLILLNVIVGQELEMGALQLVKTMIMH